MALYIRHFFIIFSSIYTYNKILNIPQNHKLLPLVNTLFSITLSFILNIIYIDNSIFRFLLIYSSSLLFLTIFTQTKLIISFTVSIISFGISFIFLALSSLFISACLSFIGVPIINLLSILLTGILQFIFICLIFKIKRLANGMPFIYKKTFVGYGLSFSFIAIIIFLLIQYIPPKSLSTRLTILSLIILTFSLLLIWWRRKITQSYVEKLRISEVEALYKEISDKDLEIEKLHVNNDELARIIHKDNKLIPAMELAVRNYLQAADSMTLEDVKQMGKDLLTHLERMSEDRQGIIHTYQEKTAYHQRCGLASIDAIVDYMEKRASDLGIEYHYQYDKDIKEKLSAYINETDAMHLLSDIIENAIIATTDQDKKMICVHIGFIQDILFMDISDSGIAFDPETYQNFGILKSTTHADHGGSGIGLMDLGRLKKQYKFSLQIYEYSPDSSDYTKKIRLLFDKKNHYLIQSYRAKEISSIVTRNDLHIFSSNNKEQRLFHI